MPKGRLGFINEYARWLLAHHWAVQAVRDPDGKFETTAYNKVYVDHARAKKWISEPTVVPVGDEGSNLAARFLAPGWNMAAAFLRR